MKEISQGPGGLYFKLLCSKFKVNNVNKCLFGMHRLQTITHRLQMITVFHFFAIMTWLAEQIGGTLTLVHYRRSSKIILSF